MASPAFDEDAFDTQAFDTDAFDITASGGGIGPTPDVTNNDRRRIGAFVKRGGVGRLRRT